MLIAHLLEPQYIATMFHHIANNSVELLRNGGEYFPALIAEIDGAKRSVWLETYIFADDDTGHKIAAALMAAAARGVAVRVVVDGFGSAGYLRKLSPLLRERGVQLAVFRPETSRFLMRRSRLRRMHRKLALIDGSVAFCGGINVIDDFNVAGYANPESFAARFDFAVRIEGDLANEIGNTMLQL